VATLLKQLTLAAAGVCLTLSGTASARQNPAPAAPLPSVSSAAIPWYPPIAKQARVDGEVRFLVSTDGERVVAAQALQYNPLLGAAAFENLRTWRFEPGPSAQFTVTFAYSLIPSECGAMPHSVDQPFVRATFPTRIELRAATDIICEGSDDVSLANRSIPVFQTMYGVSVILNPPQSSCCTPPLGSRRSTPMKRPMSLRRTSLVGYPFDARSKGVAGVVRLSVKPDGTVTIVEGPAELAAPTLAVVRTWTIDPPSQSDELRFTFRLTDGNCTGAGPVVETTPDPREMTITATRPICFNF
jgi:outer membrane biosynthesis protein TonB